MKTGLMLSIGLVMLLWFLSMIMFYRFIFMIVGIGSVILSVLFIWKFVLPILSWFQKPWLKK